MAAKIDGAADADRKIGVDLDEAGDVALIIIVARPALARHELHRERFARRQGDMRGRAPLALGDGGVEDGLQPVRRDGEALLEGLHPLGKLTSTRNKRLAPRKHRTVSSEAHTSELQ